MNYLELCQKTAQESGVISTIGDPTTTVGQTGKLLLIVDWVADAYRDIQIDNGAWRWLEGEFSGTTVNGTQRYAASDLSIASRFAKWHWPGDKRKSSFTSYLTSAGQSSETLLVPVDWEQFYRETQIGTAKTTTGSPQWVTVTPANELAFYPIPDASYTIRGRYHKAPQILAANDDTPEMPEQFHMAIVWKALDYLSTYDEAFNQEPRFQSELKRIMGKLRRNQLPMPTFGKALA